MPQRLGEEAQTSDGDPRADEGGADYGQDAREKSVTEEVVVQERLNPPIPLSCEEAHALWLFSLEAEAGGGRWLRGLAQGDARASAMRFALVSIMSAYVSAPLSGAPRDSV